MEESANGQLQKLDDEMETTLRLMQVSVQQADFMSCSNQCMQAI